MPRGSQSSRKQPGFDPRELEDLIFSPAVGTGVSSHLLDTSATDQFPFPSDPSRSLVAADIHSSLEDPSKSATQPSELEATASRTLVSAIPTKPLADEELPSEIDMATVDMSSSATVDINTTVDMYELPTVAISKLTTVEAKDLINGEAHRRAQIVDMSTVVDSDVSTVVFNDLATVSTSSSVHSRHVSFFGE